MTCLKTFSRATAARLTLAIAFIGVAISPASLHGNETDQFLLPTDRQLVDVGSYISAVHYEVLNSFVEQTNARIHDAKRINDSSYREEVLKNAHAPLTVASFVRAAFGPGFFETIKMENVLRSQAATQLFSNQLTAYKTSHWIYANVHLPFDPRKIPLALPSSTLRVFNHYVGTDKFGHFHDLGFIYFNDYTNLCRSGVDPDEALRRVIANYSHGVISEAGSIGFFATGVFSNGDLAANYLGFKFYLNLTEPVMLKGKIQPPMLVRQGDYWSLNTQVRPDSDFFSVFISDHLNEALNPCVYEPGAAGPIAKTLREHADQILTVYADENGRKRTREWFEHTAESLVTYYGEDYGHSEPQNETVTIANFCFEPAQQSTDQSPPG